MTTIQFNIPEGMADLFTLMHEQLEKDPEMAQDPEWADFIRSLEVGDVTMESEMAEHFAATLVSLNLKLALSLGIGVKEFQVIINNIASALWNQSYTHSDKHGLVHGSLILGFPKDRLLHKLVNTYGAIEAEVLGLFEECEAEERELGFEA